MSATENEPHKSPPFVKIKKAKPRTPPRLPMEGSSENWNESARRVITLRLMEHLDDGVELASELCNDPAFRSADDRVTAVLTAARMINANANLGRAICALAQVEQRKRVSVERVEKVPVSNDSILMENALAIRDLQHKLIHYLKVTADETLDPAIAEAEQAAVARRDGNASS